MTETEIDGRRKKYYEISTAVSLGSERFAMATAPIWRVDGFDEERGNLKTAVAEACINAMEHGNKLDETLPVDRHNLSRERTLWK